jgi:broad specificity phosphatase PhoE
MSNINVNIKIYWVRHGFSCANYLYDNYHLTNSITNKSKLAPDAKLTNITLNNICEMKNKIATDYYRNILNSDFILCSELTRAIETAMMLFGTFNKTIYIVPYIGEEVDTSRLGYSDNIPSDKHIKNRNIKNIIDFHNKNADKCNGMFNSEVSFDILDNLINDKKTTPDFTKFLNDVIPYLITNYNKKQLIDNTLNLTLTIVSHSQFINKTTLIYPKNLEIILQKINTSYSIINNNLLFDKMLYCNHNNKYFNFINKQNLNMMGATKYSTTKYGIIKRVNTTTDLIRCDL